MNNFLPSTDAHNTSHNTRHLSSEAKLRLPIHKPNSVRMQDENAAENFDKEPAAQMKTCLLAEKWFISSVVRYKSSNNKSMSKISVFLKIKPLFKIRK